MNDGASATTAKAPEGPDPLVGRTIGGRFAIRSVIARGGMGKVYRAEQAPLGRVCAIKVLTPSYSGGQDPEFHKRFFLEASIASRLTHPNTVTIFDYGKTDDDIYYMAMEYLEGRTLHRAIRQAGFMPEARAAHIARQICRALREAHTLGVIHRDLKPANVYLVEHGDERDFVKVLDFGLVKQLADDPGGEELTRTGLFMGSPKYMAPEQIRGERVDARTDVYALGIILYEMVAGKAPFERQSSVHILTAHVNEAPPPILRTNPAASVSPGLEETIARCLAKDPDERFGSMDEVLTALKAVAAPVEGSSASGSTALGSGPLPHANAHPAASGSSPSLSSAAPAESGMKPLLPTTQANPQASGSVSGATLSPARTGTRRSGHRAALVGTAVAVVACGGAGFGYLQWRASADAARVSAEESARVAAAASASASAAARQAKASDLIVKVRITTDPDGAAIKENGVSICSSTPCDVLYADADPDRVHEITVSLAGYRTEVRRIHVGDSPVVLRLAAEPAGE